MNTWTIDVVGEALSSWPIDLWRTHGRVNNQLTWAPCSQLGICAMSSPSNGKPSLGIAGVTLSPSRSLTLSAHMHKRQLWNLSSLHFLLQTDCNPSKMILPLSATTDNLYSWMAYPGTLHRPIRNRCLFATTVQCQSADITEALKMRVSLRWELGFRETPYRHVVFFMPKPCATLWEMSVLCTWYSLFPWLRTVPHWHKDPELVVGGRFVMLLKETAAHPHDIAHAPNHPATALFSPSILFTNILLDDKPPTDNSLTDQYNFSWKTTFAITVLTLNSW